MRNFFQNFSYRMQYFMQGRYGDDELNRVLSRTGLVLVLISLFSRLWWPLAYLSPVGFFLALVSIFRMFSRNIYKRQRENAKYNELVSPVRKKRNLYSNMMREKNTHSYYKCPNCKTYVRLRKPPKGKKIAVRCTKCQNEFIKRT